MQEAGLELSKSTFSHHLRIMREAGLVTKRIQGARGYAQLRIHPRENAAAAGDAFKDRGGFGLPGEFLCILEAGSERATGGTHVTGVGYLHAATAFPGHPRLSLNWFQARPLVRAGPRFRPDHAWRPRLAAATAFPHAP